MERFMRAQQRALDLPSKIYLQSFIISHWFTEYYLYEQF